MRKKFLLATSLAFTVLGIAPVWAQTAPTVAVRAGSHGTFDRVVFDWPRNVKFVLKQDGDHASITFDATGDMKFTQDVATQLSRARGFSAHSDDSSHVTVSFTVNPDATLKTFTSNSSVVIDISGKTAPTVAETPPQVPAPATQPPAPPAANGAATSKPQPLVPPPAAAPPPASGPLKTTVAPKVNAAVPPASSSPSASTSVASVRKPGDQLELADAPMLVAVLDPHVPARTAIYQRADVGYIVFDRKLALSIPALENGIPPKIDLQPLDMANNSGYRFTVPPNADLQATLDGTVWKIFLSKKQGAMPVTTALVAQPDFALGARFLLPLPDAPTPVHLVDPVVGDDLILVPLAQSEAFNADTAHVGHDYFARRAGACDQAFDR